MDDVVVIGGSFAGLSAAMQIARARRRVLVLDTNSPRNRFAQHSHGVLGHDGKPPGQLIEEAERQVLAYPSASLINEKARSAKRDGEGFMVTTEAGIVLSARRLILAYGIKDDLPDVPGLADCWGISVLHCPYCHAHEYADKRLGMILSAATSPGMARMLQDWSRNLTVFIDGAELEADARSKMQSWGITLVEEPIAGIEHKDGQLSAVRLDSGKSIALDATFIHTRHAPSCGIGDELGCARREGSLGPFIAVDEHQRTSIEGIYAAGDVAWEKHNISWAIAHGAAAGIAAHQSLIE